LKSAIRIEAKSRFDYPLSSLSAALPMNKFAFRYVCRFGRWKGEICVSHPSIGVGNIPPKHVHPPLRLLPASRSLLMKQGVGLERTAVVRLRPSFSAHVRWGERGAPLRICETAGGLRGRPAVSHISRKTSEMPGISCTQLSTGTARAPFIKERRRKFREPTRLHRKSGMWGTRRLVRG
jgi:hypothetical protein